MKKVRMRHPKLPGQEIEVPESAARVHANSGWKLIAEKAEVFTGEGGERARRASNRSVRKPEANATEEAS